jgi:O-antigen/teichoic acid export membrane protein
LTRSREAALVAYRAFSDVAGKGAFFLVTVLAARVLTEQGFGVFSLGTTLGWMIAVVADFGMALHVAREVARRKDQARQVLATWLRVRLATSAGLLLVAAASISLTRTGPRLAAALWLFVLVYVVSGLIEFLYYFYRGLSRSDIESTLTLWHRFAMLVLAAAALAWIPDVTVLAVAMLLPGIATLGFSLRLAFALTREHSAETVDARQTFFSDVMPIGVGIVLSALYFRIDVFLVQFWSGIEAVAAYNAVFRLVEALRLFPAAVLAVMLPALCRASNMKPLSMVALAVTGFAVVVSAVLWALAGTLVPLVYGQQYAAAAPAFRILLLSFPLMSLNYALTHQLVGWNGQRAYAMIAGTALVFNVALNTRLIPAMSIAGAAWSTLLTEALLTIGCVVALRRASPAVAVELLQATGVTVTS